MSSAKVLSLEALENFRLDLQQFRDGLLRELENLDLELRRLTQWIEVESAGYWSNEQQQARRRLAEFTQQLSRCMSYVREDERKPCTEEKKRVERTKQRTALCETKLRWVASATTVWQSRLSKVRTKAQRCRDMADADLVVAINHLLTHIQRLESYSQLRSQALGGKSTAPRGSNVDDLPNASDEPAATSEPPDISGPESV